SESRQPRISSSSAISSSSSLTCLLQLLLERIAVDAVVVAVQLIDELLDPHDRPALDHPERDRLAAAAEHPGRDAPSNPLLPRTDPPHQQHHIYPTILPNELPNDTAPQTDL